MSSFPDLAASAVHLQTDTMQATFVPEWGGMMVSLQVYWQEQWRELLYLHDDFAERRLVDLPGGGPFCFPVCGRVSRNNQSGLYMYDAKPYHLSIHGFAWQQAWQVLEKTTDRVLMQLRSNKTTLQQYPFQFEVTLDYQLTENGLSCRQCYRNCGETVMPFQAGFHPYFLTPPVESTEDSTYTKQDVRLTCHSTRQLIYNNDLTDIVDSKHSAATDQSISAPDLNERLVMLSDDHNVQLHFPDGFQITMNVAGDDSFFSYLQTYTIPDKPFICIEPWSGFPNAINTSSGMCYLPAHTEKHAVLDVYCQ